MWPVAAVLDSTEMSASNFTVSEVFKLVSENQRCFFSGEKGRPSKWDPGLSPSVSAHAGPSPFALVYVLGG